MKSNSKKHNGFSLIEVVVSIGILSVVSIAIYGGCMIISKQTKAAQIKQTAALEGKKIVEVMKATSFAVPNSTSDYLTIGAIKLQKEEDASGNIFYTRYLDEKYKDCTKDVSKYQEEVTITPAKANNTVQTTTGESVELNTNDLSYHNKLYISKINVSETNSEDYMGYWEDAANSEYTLEKDTSKVLIPSNSTSQIQMYIYFTTATTTGYQNIEIKDYAGQKLLSITKSSTDDKDLYINFSNYLDSNGLVPTNENIELDIYNKTTTDIPKIYIEKSKDLNVDVEARKGEINIYDNRAEDATNENVGTLYDIKLEISDYLKYKNGEIHEDKDNLFTGHSKKNIH